MEEAGLLSIKKRKGKKPEITLIEDQKRGGAI
jgi:hypothetical protein